MHQQSSQSENMGSAAGPVSGSRRSVAFTGAFRMSRRDLVATALLVSGASAIVVTAALTVRNRNRPEPLPSLLDLKPPRENPWQTRHMPLYFECESSACRATAEDLRKNVAWSLNPCADFYEYVCSSDRTQTNVYDHAVAHYLREVREVIRKYQNLGFFSRTAMSKKITRFFSACQSNQLQLSSWRSQLAHVWQYLDLAGNLAGVESMLATFSRVLEVFPVVHVAVLEASRRTCVVLSKPDGKGADRLFQVPHAFSTSFPHFAADLLGHTGKVPDDANDLINSAAKMEAELQKYSGPQGEQYYHLHEYGDIPASEVGNGSAAFDWTTYLRNFLTGVVSVKADSCVIVKSPAYVRHVVKAFGKVSKKDVRSFLKLRAAMALMPFRRLADAPDKEDMEKLCTLATYKLYRYAFLKEFNDTQLLQVFVSAGEKEVIVRMSYRNVITDALPASKSKNKVEEAMKSAKSKYFRIIKDVDHYYYSDATKPDKEIAYNYVQGLGSMTQSWLRVVVASGGKIQDNQLNIRWDFDPDTNKLVVPVSIGHMKLKADKEFFLESTGLGGAMVQFLYRAFHERALFSARNASEQDRHNKTATACLEKQYGSKTVNETKVNGRRVLRAVAADNALVPVLHKAFKTSLYIHKIEVINYKRLEMSLANLPDVDADQLFFLMYGQTFCEPHEDTARVLAQAPWPPAKIRLNTALANYPEFAKAFKCGNGTAMNPKKRCSVFSSH
ncbi:neprilysin-1-like [Dermacentor andersoni]|uniref:neprilysin-1-like n=1 Tax=Dermacentor andersoni TaxID=34620 RepID=UPI00215567CF|nr:neprilysin-1-like [Dermacentor andersoni]